MSKLIYSLLLIAIGVSFRTIWHVGDNIEFVTTSALLAGAYLGLKASIAVPLAIMIISDLLLGNTNIFIFTWSAYLFIGVLGYLSHLSGQKGRSKIKLATGLGVVASLWFYLWTNFGVWLLDSWGMYPKTAVGLIQAYWYGLPFLKLNLLGNLFFVPLSFFIVEKLVDIKILGSANWRIKKIRRIKNIHST